AWAATRCPPGYPPTLHRARRFPEHQRRNATWHQPRKLLTKLSVKALPNTRLGLEASDLHPDESTTNIGLFKAGLAPSPVLRQAVVDPLTQRLLARLLLPAADPSFECHGPARRINAPHGGPARRSWPSSLRAPFPGTGRSTPGRGSGSAA